MKTENAKNYGEYVEIASLFKNSVYAPKRNGRRNLSITNLWLAKQEIYVVSAPPNGNSYKKIGEVIIYKMIISPIFI